MELRAPEGSTTLNDVHSQLNPTEVAAVIRPRTVPAVQGALAEARRASLPVAIAGGRHAMGGQQFATDGLVLDLSALSRVLSFDRERGLVEVEAGIQWPRLFEALERLQIGEAEPWVVRQKQTGADCFSLGGSSPRTSTAAGSRGSRSSTTSKQ